MLDIDALERRWLKYKLKTYLPYLIGATLATVAIAGTAIWLSTDTVSTDKGAPPPKRAIAAISPSSEHNAAAPIPEASTVLEPSMDFVQSFQNASMPPEPTSKALPKTPKTSVQVSSPPPPPKMLNMPESAAPAPAAMLPPPSKGAERSLTINRNESKLDIEELQRRFKETSNANLGLFIARYYYDHGNYSEAYNYALKTNALNSKIDESWILFAKSLIKLGKTDQAKKTLQLYISQSNSESAKELLNSIEKGTGK